MPTVREEEPSKQLADALSLLKSAKERAEKASKAEEAAHKETFETWFQCLAASASRSNFSGGGSDNHGLASVEAEAAEVLPNSAVSRSALKRLWQDALSALSALPQPLLKPTQAEVKGVHPVVAALLQAAVPVDKRLWRDVIAPDSNSRQEMKPDFTVTAARDAQPSSVGSALTVVVKLPGDLNGAVIQACTFGRRRLLRLFLEADRRGEVALLHTLSVLVAASDGFQIRFVRIWTGAAPPGSSFKGLQPCPSFITPPAPLLERNGDAAVPSPEAPLGFKQLADVLAAASHDLNPSGSPLSSVDALLPSASTSPLQLLLDQRLGSGGFSDAYSLLTAVPGVEESLEKCCRSCVLKVARCESENMALQFDMEARTLRALAAANAPFVPRLLAAGVCSGGSWPLHIISPRGRPLAAALEEVLKAAGSPQDKRRLRLEFADRVLVQTQAAARAAHGLQVVHCDIRVDNCLVDADGDVCLIDWGLVRERGEPALKVGVPAFALGAQFDGTVSTCAAAERVDLAAAALLWLCVAYGQACRAPWPTHVAEEGAASQRSLWINGRVARGDVLLQSVSSRLEQLDNARWRPAPADYDWVPTAEAAACT